MIVDSSALVAIVRREKEWAGFSVLITSSEDAKMSSASYLETSIVVSGGRDNLTIVDVDEVIEMLALQIVPFDLVQARIAREAYGRFGKGSGHKAQLNFGDCFAYALAIDTDQPLLFKGEDFSKTDVKIASV